MQYFNAVLVPAEEYKNKLTRFCDANLQPFSDGYCLGAKVFPHITLCQFQANAYPTLDMSFEYSPVHTGFNKRAGTGKHTGFMWFEIAIKKNDEIIQWQNQVQRLLNDIGITSTTPPSDLYAPHVSLCRYVDEIDVMLDNELLNLPSNWKFEIGRSDPNGQYFG